MNDQEILEALNKSEAIPPVLCMSERSVTFVEYADGHGEAKTQVNNWFRCPRCNGIVGERRFVHKRIIDQRTKQFCEKCGQKMEWGQEKKRAKEISHREYTRNRICGDGETCQRWNIYTYRRRVWK